MNRIAALPVIAAGLLALVACGLDGVAGQLVRFDGDYYIIKGADGHEMSLHVDQRTRKDTVAPGDYVHAFVTKEGHAEFIQRMDAP